MASQASVVSASLFLRPLMLLLYLFTLPWYACNKG